MAVIQSSNAILLPVFEISYVSTLRRVNNLADSVWFTIFELANNHLAGLVVEFQTGESRHACYSSFYFEVFKKWNAALTKHRKNIFSVDFPLKHFIKVFAMVFTYS